MRYARYLAVALLVVAAYAFGQGKKKAPAGPYRAVMTVGLMRGRGSTKDRFWELPYVTQALNNLHAQGYEPALIMPLRGQDATQMVIVTRQKR